MKNILGEFTIGGSEYNFIIEVVVKEVDAKFVLLEFSPGFNSKDKVLPEELISNILYLERYGKMNNCLDIEKFSYNSNSTESKLKVTVLKELYINILNFLTCH